MGHERLMQLKTNLLNAIEGQMCNIYDADCEELGAAIDMLKDIEEAIYFCTITEAMNGKGKYGSPEIEIEYGGKEKKGHHQMNGDSPQMYYPMYSDGSSQMYATSGGSYGGYSSGGGRGSSSSGNSGSSSSNYTEPMMERDSREGRSPNSRRMYMEAKEMKRDKTAQLRELEKYMQELSQDMVEMISDASPEEKQYLEKKITALASKVGQLK